MKIQLLPLLTILSALTFTTQAEVNTKAFYECKLIKKDVKRLQCYDNILINKPSKKEKKTEPTVAQANKFGLEHKNITAEGEENIEAIVKNIKKAPYGELIITLDNNQVWRQSGTEGMSLKKADLVEIRRGALNSFLLKKVGLNRSIRVKRVK